MFEVEIEGGLALRPFSAASTISPLQHYLEGAKHNDHYRTHHISLYIGYCTHTQHLLTHFEIIQYLHSNNQYCSSIVVVVPVPS